MIEFTHVDGIDRGDIKLFALSTCVWCKRTKQLLASLGVAYDYIFVDELDGEEREEAVDRVRKQNPRCSYPTLIINEKECIVGFKQELIEEALGDRVSDS